MVEKQPFDPTILDTLKDSFLSLQTVIEKRIEDEEMKILKIQSEMPELIKLKKMMDEMDDIRK